MFDKLGYVDSNGDGYLDAISGLPSGITPGSEQAKKLWQQIDADAHSEANIAKAKTISGCENARGLFMGKALVPGPGANQGDFDYLVAKLHLVNGIDLTTAKKIAASVKNRLYGGR